MTVTAGQLFAEIIHRLPDFRIRICSPLVQLEALADLVRRNRLFRYDFLLPTDCLHSSFSQPRSGASPRRRGSSLNWPWALL